MKICFLGLDNLPVLSRGYASHAIGGEQVQQTLLARALVQRGAQVSMAVFDYGQADGAAWDGVTTHIAYGAGAGLPLWRFVHPRWSGMWAAMRRADADIYYASCAGMQLGLAALFCRRHGRKLVFRVAHDNDCEPAQLLVRYWRDRKLYEYGLRRADAVLVQTEWQRQRLAVNYAVAGRLAGMLVEPAQLPQPRDIDVLWVNNLRPFKRPELFLALARRLPQLACHMIGGSQPGSEALYDSLRDEAATIPNLTFHGRLPYHAMASYYAAARVFVNTSDTEGFPNSYLQAWVRGTPVVAFFDPDGVIAREQLGAAVATLAQMGERVAQLAGAGAAWQAAAQRCRRYMAQRYADEVVLAPYLALFAELAP